MIKYSKVNNWTAVVLMATVPIAMLFGATIANIHGEPLNKPTPFLLSDIQDTDDLTAYYDYIDAKVAYDKQQLREAIASGFQPENQNFTTIEQLTTYLDSWEKNQTSEKELLLMLL